MHCSYLSADQTTSTPFSISPFPQHAISGDKNSRLLSAGLVLKKVLTTKRPNYYLLKIWCRKNINFL
jgi:hypothetical protein